MSNLEIGCDIWARVMEVGAAWKGEVLVEWLGLTQGQDSAINGIIPSQCQRWHLFPYL